MIKKNIPNLFTLANLFCGCVAVIFACAGALKWATYLVGIACIFDFLDGLVARILKINSGIGKELDSLAELDTKRPLRLAAEGPFFQTWRCPGNAGLYHAAFFSAFFAAVFSALAFSAACIAS